MKAPPVRRFIFRHHLIFLYGDDFFTNRDLVINSEIQIPNFIEYQEKGSQPEKTAEPWIFHKPEEVSQDQSLINRTYNSE